MIDNKKKEDISVIEIQRLISLCPMLSENIQKHEKNELDDGTILVYSSEKMDVSHIDAIFNVQIKGTTKKVKRSKGYATHSVPIVHMEKYADLFGGVLFFLVTIDGKSCRPKQAYYEKLLPCDIDGYLARAKGKRNLTIRLRPFPSEPREIFRVVRGFADDWKKQAVAKVFRYSAIDGEGVLQDNFKNATFTISKRLYPGESFASIDAFRDRTYVYTNNEDGNNYVVDSIDNVRIVVLGKTVVVSSGECTFKTDVFCGERIDERGEKWRHIEVDGLIIEFNNENDERVMRRDDGGMRRRLRTASLAYELYRTQKIQIEGHQPIELKKLDFSEKEFLELEEYRKTCERMARTLEILGVREDWDPSLFTHEEACDFELLCRAFAEGKHLHLNEEESPFTYFDIQGRRIFVALVRLKNGLVRLENLLSEDLSYAFGWPSKPEAGESEMVDPVPAITILSKESYRMLANADSSTLDALLVRYPVTEGNHELLNQQLLVMLSAFDAGSARPKELLSCCLSLANALYEYDSTVGIATINLMQTIRRGRQLTDDERQSLRRLIASDEPCEIKAAACAILGDLDLASTFKSKCSNDKKALLEDWPISKFFDTAVAD